MSALGHCDRNCYFFCGGSTEWNQYTNQITGC